MPCLPPKEPGGQLDEARQHRRQLHARELGAAVVLDDNREILAEIGDVGKRMPGIERQRREHRRNLAVEVVRQPLAKVIAVARGIQKRGCRAARVPGRSSSLPAPALFHEHGQRALPHQRDLLLRRQAVARHGFPIGAQLLVQRGHADHEELVEIGADDREELHALEQRMRGSRACARTRSLNASQLSSRLM